MSSHTLRALALCATLAAAAPVTAQTVSLTVGAGDEDTTLYRLGYGQDYAHWATDGAWQWTGAWLAELGYWESDDPGNKSLWEAALTPVFRLEATQPGDVSPYLELGLGGHVLSDTRIGDRRLATAWQFGSHLGLGLALGRSARVAYRFQHLSNASIKQPNAGINFHQLVLDWRF